MWMNGFMTLRVQQASQQQVTIAAREALHSLLRPDDVEVSAILVSTTSTATRSTATWRVAFAVGELASEDFAASRTTLLTLAERVASSRASVFSAEVENELLNVGARPGQDFAVLALSMEIAEQVDESNTNGWLILVVIGVILGVAGITLFCLRKGCQEVRPAGPVMASKALWQLEEERWELAEKVLEVPATDIQVPQQWRAQWNSAASSVPEVRSYDLTFGPGGRLEGLSDGSNGAFRVDGAFDVEEGTIRWREVSLSYGTGAPSVVECYGQWDPRSGRIDGFFSAFDVSTLPQQIGQGHFALTSRAAKDAAHPPLLPPVPPPSSAMSSARHAHDFEAAESDMV